MGQFLDNQTAFDDFIDLMSRLGAADVSIDEYMIILFNNSEAVDLLVAAVGTNVDGQQAIFDAIGNNTDAQLTFLLELGDNLMLGRNSGSTTESLDYSLPDDFTLPGIEIHFTYSKD